MIGSIDSEQTRARGLSVLPELLRTMRPKDWIKNTFVFAAIAFAYDAQGRPLWLDPQALIAVFSAFLLFCMVASAIYLINDLVDIEKDRAHPKKRNRPLASGRLSPRIAVIAAVLLLVVALPLGFLIDINGENTLSRIDFGLALLTYLVVQGLLYSYYLKNIVIIDIFTIASGFVLRAVAGALVLSIVITPWLLVCMGLLALFLGLSKRRSELSLLQAGAGEHRRILAEYSMPMLDQMIGIVTAATIMAYTLFTFTAETLPLEPFPVMMVTVPFVIYAIFRYLYHIHKGDGGGNAAELLINDRSLLVCVALWGLTSVAIMAFASFS
jgi:4-hydroxybenzoate polyprenyltransferase